MPIPDYEAVSVRRERKGGTITPVRERKKERSRTLWTQTAVNRKHPSPQKKKKKKEKGNEHFMPGGREKKKKRTSISDIKTRDPTCSASSSAAR